VEVPTYVVPRSHLGSAQGGAKGNSELRLVDGASLCLPGRWLIGYRAVPGTRLGGKRRD
jgi:hypothetical protein